MLNINGFVIVTANFILADVGNFNSYDSGSDFLVAHLGIIAQVVPGITQIQIVTEI